MQSRFRALARRVYHSLPLSQQAKWRLRERLHPLAHALQHAPNAKGMARGVVHVLRGTQTDGSLARDCALEWAIAEILFKLGKHAERHGPVTHWITLPFLSTGGAEQVALNLCRALRSLRPNQSVALLVTDRALVSERVILPDGVVLIAFDDYLGDNASQPRRQALLLNLLLAIRPDNLHNINSEVAWQLIIAEGERLRRFIRLHASIFAFQFAPDGRTRIGYAAYFLQRALPHLTSLTADNQSFIKDAITEYGIDEASRARLHVLYQPCRLMGESPSSTSAAQAPGTGPGERPRILWAGRLDAEKRIDLFLDVVRHCTWADFHIYGQVVLDGSSTLPSLPNLHYEGPFSSPYQWQEKHRFDAFLFTSKWEGLPNILIEAGSLGLPIIAPVVGGVGELVTPETGFPLPERPTVDDYAKAIKAIANNPFDAGERAARMRTLIEERHGWSRFIACVAAVPGYLAADTGLSALPCRTARPQVSVIVPCYNQGPYLVECVASILLACRDTLEIIIVDDGSTAPQIDRHLAAAKSLAPDIVRIHRQANQGLSGARNTGLSLAQGEYIQFLDTDDLLAPEKIDVQLAQLRSNPTLDVSVCDFLLSDEPRNVFSKLDVAIARFDFEEADFLYRWERGFVIPIHCALFRRRIVDHFDTEARAKEDWLFWVGLSLRGARFAYVHGHWAIYRQHPESMRRSYVNMGRAWLQAGLKIESRLGGREPLFFESVVAWFEQCYRGNPAYKQEIAHLQNAGSTQPAPLPSEVKAAANVDTERLLEQLRPACGTQTPVQISVIVPIYNHYDYLERCLASLAKQGDAPLEIICIDDASPDSRVADLMQALQGRLPGLKIVRQTENSGISAVQNKAVELATGHYVAFLDCDDALEPGALQTVRQAIDAHPDVDYFFTDRLDVDVEERTLRVARYGGYDSLPFRSQADIAEDLYDGMVASHLKIIRRSAYAEAGGCDAALSGVQDWDLALKIAERGKLYYIDQAVYRHRVHAASVTRSDHVAQFRKSNLARRRHSERNLLGPTAIGATAACQYIGRRDFPISTAQLRAYWKQGLRCTADARGPLFPAQINFLREFNSYFDRIEWDDPAVAAALTGYLWNPAILVRRN